MSNLAFSLYSLESRWALTLTIRAETVGDVVECAKELKGSEGGENDPAA